MASLVDQNPENRAEHRSARSQETPSVVDPAAPAAAAMRETPLVTAKPDNDLPDIVDIVREMGRAPEVPPADEAKALRHDDPWPSGRSPSFASAAGPSGTPEGFSDARRLAAGAVGRTSPLPVVPAAGAPLPAHLETLADQARKYVEAASSANTRRAYASDWKHFSSWCRRQGFALLPPDPQTVGLYITALASGSAAGAASGDKKTVATIERRLSALTWNFAQRGQMLDRKDRHIATVMAGIRNKHASPPRQKEAVLPEDLIAMLETLPRGILRGLRDRAMLLVGFAGGLRRSEITGLDVGRDQTEDSSGWVEFFPGKGLLVTLRGKTGWREVEIGRGSSDATCPVVALETWLKFAKIAHG
ncbi:MAG: integrase, partial [Mesorhizobium sp.]